MAGVTFREDRDNAESVRGTGYLIPSMNLKYLPIKPKSELKKGQISAKI